MAKPEKIAHSKLLAYYGNLLTRYQKEILREYYDCDLSILEIAEEFGISRQAVSDVLKRATDKLREADEKLEIIAHSARVYKELDAFRAKWLDRLPEAAKKEFSGILDSVREI